MSQSSKLCTFKVVYTRYLFLKFSNRKYKHNIKLSLFIFLFLVISKDIKAEKRDLGKLPICEWQHEMVLLGLFWGSVGALLGFFCRSVVALMSLFCSSFSLVCRFLSLYCHSFAALWSLFCPSFVVILSLFCYPFVALKLQIEESVYSFTFAYCNTRKMA